MPQLLYSKLDNLVYQGRKAFRLSAFIFLEEIMNSHELPSGFKDEEKWLKFFSKRTFKILGVTFGTAVILYNFFKLFGVAYIGAIIGGILIVTFVAPSMIPLPADDYMKGGGQTVDRWVFKVLYHKIKMAVYVKYYSSAADVVAEAEERRKYMLMREEEEE